MICIVLAAGYATRLYPLTENFPKPLLPVGEKTILDHLLDDLAATGCVDRYVIVSNHRYIDAFRAYAEKKTLPILVLDDGSEQNETRLGAVRDIAFALRSIAPQGAPTEDVLVIAGDNVLDFSLGALLRYAAEKQTSCVMRYEEPSVERLRKCGVITVDGEDRITSMVEKPPVPPSHHCVPPFYFYRAADAARAEEALAEGCGADAPGSFLAWLAARTTVHAMPMPGHRYDVGNLESYRAVCDGYRGIGAASPVPDSNVSEA